MTDTTTTTGDKAGKDDDGAGQGAAAEGAKSDAGSTDWKAEARKWEDRAKANVSAAEELQQLKDAEKTEDGNHLREVDIFEVSIVPGVSSAEFMDRDKI